MHARGVRKVLGRQWIWLQRAAFLAIAMQVAFYAFGALADTSVDFLQIQRKASFESNRIYSGIAVAKRASELGFKQRGEILELAVDMGDRVSKGDVLARLDASALQASLRGAEADVAFAKATLTAQRADTKLAHETEKRFRDLKHKGHVSAQRYDETRLALVAKQAQLKVAAASKARAEAARSSARISLQESQIVAPFDGVIQHRHHDEGSQVAPGQAVFRLVADEQLEAHVGVPAAVAADMALAQNYEIRWNQQPFQAQLRAIAPEIDAATRTMTAVFEFADAAIPLGAVLEFRLARTIAAPGFWVPLSALTESDRGLWGVYVVNTDQLVERHLVEVVHTEADRAFVRGTLSSADRVIRTGVQRIVPGQRVELAQN